MTAPGTTRARCRWSAVLAGSLIASAAAVVPVAPAVAQTTTNQPGTVEPVRGGLAEPSVGVDAAGDYYVGMPDPSAPGQDQLLRVAPDGSQTVIAGSNGSQLKYNFVGLPFAVDPEGDVFLEESAPSGEGYANKYVAMITASGQQVSLSFPYLSTGYGSDQDDPEAIAATQSGGHTFVAMADYGSGHGVIYEWVDPSSSNSTPGIVASGISVPSLAMAFGPDGSLYFASDCVVLDRLAQGRITRVAGTGEARYTGDVGPPLDASFGSLQPNSGCITSLAVDPAGTVYVGDPSYRVRKVTPRTISTVAGIGSPPSSGSDNGDGGSAWNADISPKGLAVDAAGDLLLASADPSLDLRRVTGITAAPSEPNTGSPAGSGLVPVVLLSSAGGLYGAGRPSAVALCPHSNHPLVGVASVPAGGQWCVASDGGVFTVGTTFHGSTGAVRLNRPIVGMAPTPDGAGYLLVAADGGVFSFGDAGFHGSAGALRLNRPIVGIASTPDGGGYWLVASDGGVFSFGDAAFHGSTGAIHLNRPIIALSPTPDGAGYWLVASDGGVFTFGDAPYLGSAPGEGIQDRFIGIADQPGRYMLVGADARLFAFPNGASFVPGRGSSAIIGSAGW